MATEHRTAMLVIDTTTGFGARVAERLANDQVVWLTTVGDDLTPQPSPVWFYWDGIAATIYSQPRAPKLRNISQRPRVSLSFNSTETGGDIVILTGMARLAAEAPPADAFAEFLAKYAEGLVSVGMTAAEFAREYSAAIRVQPTGLRGF